MSSGFYGNATKVIRVASRRMQAEEERASGWKAAHRQGDDDLDAGQSVRYTAVTLDEITQSAKKAMHSAQAADADVLP